MPRADASLVAPLEEHLDQTRELLAAIPLGRMGKLEEVGGLALYLASDAASDVTGSTYLVDGAMVRHSGNP